MVVMIWSDCGRHGVIRIGVSRPETKLVVL